jgi:hypothetical protein
MGWRLARIVQLHAEDWLPTGGKIKDFLIFRDNVGAEFALRCFTGNAVALSGITEGLVGIFSGLFSYTSSLAGSESGPTREEQAENERAKFQSGDENGDTAKAVKAANVCAVYGKVAHERLWLWAIQKDELITDTDAEMELALARDHAFEAYDIANPKHSGV